jgi:four helix bundle protein
VEAKKPRSYRDLEFWNLSIDLVKEVYKLTGTFPASENFGLTKQIRRAAASNPSTIAKGQDKNSPKEFRQFLAVGLISVAELETQLVYSPSDRIYFTRRTSALIEHPGRH